MGFRTLRGRIFGALFVISLLPMFILGAQGYHCARQAVVELSHKHLRAVADARATLVMEWIAERKQDLATLAALSPMTKSLMILGSSGDPHEYQAAQNNLELFQKLNPDFEDLTLYGLDWSLLVQVSRSNHTVEELRAGSLRSAMENTVGTYLHATHLHATGNVGLHIVHPLLDESGVKTGYLVANLDFSKSLDRPLQNREGLYESGKVYIASRNLDILTQPFPGKNTTTSHPRANSDILVNLGEPAHEVRNYTDYLGNQVLATAVPIPLHDWFLVAEIDAREALEWVNVLLLRLSITILVTCFVVMLVAAWITRLVGKPLKELVRVSGRIRAGHVDERLGPMEVYEAEELRMAFNRMMDELREKQEQLVRTATLAYVGELTSSTIHEMRNPLSSIKLNVQALAKVVKEEPLNREISEIALTQVDRLERMFTDLLQFGRPVDLDIQPVIFSDMIKDMFDLIEFWTKQKKVRFETIDDLEGTLLHVDREQFCRALTNLVLNAIEASPENGLVEIHGRSVGSTGETIEISVTDSGPGLSAKGLECAFQPFFTTKPEGTGLGLSNVKKIVDLHGGMITAENLEEGGATFRINLPADRSGNDGS